MCAKFIPIRVQREDFHVAREIDNLKSTSKRIGGIVTFLGTARDFSRGKEIEKLEFESYEAMAEKKLEGLRQAALERFDIIEASIIHRVGEISVGENIVLIAVGAEHREDAFKACKYLIDELKKVVPIWKKEFTTSGDYWVEGNP